MIKKTALNRIHHALGAKMVEFAGFEMPIQYHSIREEHKRVRKTVGVFDVSHMGEIIVENIICITVGLNDEKTSYNSCAIKIFNSYVIVSKKVLNSIQFS